MTDMASLHKTARSLILGLREGLERLEKAENVRAPLKKKWEGAARRNVSAPPRPHTDTHTHTPHTGRPAHGGR